VNGNIHGSGFLIGPNLVLTAWHVIAVTRPSEAEDPTVPAPRITVRFEDGTNLDAAVPPSWASLCADSEFDGKAPRSDAEVAGLHDVALLRVSRPVAAWLGYGDLPATASVPEGSMFLAHLPKGVDRGLGNGSFRKIPNVNARWGHRGITTDEGSSGGACFGTDLLLAGVHQGRLGEGGRLIPVSQFLDEIRPLVEEATRPRSIWSLNGAPDGTLVIGRDRFFDGVAAAGTETTRVRGVHIKRRDIRDGTTGLGFSYDILAQLLERRGIEQKLVRIPFDSLMADLGEDISRRTELVGVVVPSLPQQTGVDPGQAALEGATRKAADDLARVVNAAAEAAGVTVWYFFDNPSVAMPEQARLYLEGFVAAGLLQPRLRLVMCGFETLQLAGIEFSDVGIAGGDGAPGLAVEWLGGFKIADILSFLALAAKDLTGTVNQTVIEQIAKRVLLPLEKQRFGGVYPASSLMEVKKALLPDLQLWAQQGAVQ
jgi:hypothetical protein